MARRGGVPVGTRWLNKGMTPERIVDLLETEGTGMTKWEIADRLGTPVEVTYRALKRLQQRSFAYAIPAEGAHLWYVD